MSKFALGYRGFWIGFAIGGAAVLALAFIREFLWSQEAAAWAGAFGTVAAIAFAYLSGASQERRRQIALRTACSSTATGALAAAAGTINNVRDPTTLRGLASVEQTFYALDAAEQAFVGLPIWELHDLQAQIHMRLVRNQINLMRTMLALSTANILKDVRPTPEEVRGFEERYLETHRLCRLIDTRIATPDPWYGFPLQAPRAMPREQA